MTEQQARIICEHHGIMFVNRSYGMCSTKTITLMCLHHVINDAIKWQEQQDTKSEQLPPSGNNDSVKE